MWRWVDHPQITIPNSTHIIKLTNAASSGKVEKIPVTHPEILRRILPPISKFTYIWSFISYLGSIFPSFKISFSCLESVPLSLFNNQIYQLCCIFIIYQSPFETTERLHDRTNPERVLCLNPSSWFDLGGFVTLLCRCKVLQGEIMFSVSLTVFKIPFIYEYVCAPACLHTKHVHTVPVEVNRGHWVSWSCWSRWL